MQALLLLVVSLELVAVAVALSIDPFVVRERQHREQGFDLPYHQRYVKSERASSEVKLTLVIAVTQLNVDLMEKLLLNKSTVGHASYALPHLNAEDVRGLVTNLDGVRAVRKYIEKHDGTIVLQSLNEEYLSVSMAVRSVERAFNTIVWNFRLVDGLSTSILRAEQYSLPLSLEAHVAAVFDLVHLPSSNSNVLKVSPATAPPSFASADQHSDRNFGASCPVIFPESLRRIYGLDVSTASPLASQCVLGSMKEMFDPQDLAQFQREFHQADTPIATIYHQSSGRTDGHAYCSTNPNDCQEASLDVQMMTSMGSAAKSYFYYEKDGLSIDANNVESDSSFVWFLSNLTAMADPPMVVSISYGGPEGDIHPVILRLFEIESIKLLLRGTTVVASSGDSGANYSPDLSFCGYYPQFPSSSRFVLSVGATIGGTEDSLIPTNEVGCSVELGSVITSGGGFSGISQGMPFQRGPVDYY